MNTDPMAKEEIKAEEQRSPFVIVIGRQFGSGGRTIGKMIASRLGIDYYDTELIKAAAQQEGIRPEIFKEHDEKKPSVLKTLLQGAYGIADNFHQVPLSGERVYNVQSKVIKDLCKKGSCVIVGRNADFILRNHPGLLSVFLHAPLEFRVKRIIQRGESLDEESAISLATQHDKRRESYYNFYTGEKKWGLASNYHLCLDTSRYSNEAIADLIIQVLQSGKRFQNT